MAGRSYEEVLERFRLRRAEEAMWRERAVEFGELASLDKMHYAQERVNELAWMLEGFEKDVAVPSEASRTRES